MHEPRYISLANKLAAIISNGIYKAGDKLPSLRSLAGDHGLSVGTVLQAFNHLVDKGLVTSKEKSGYFVSYRLNTRLPQPQTVPIALVSRSVHIDRLLQRLKDDSTGKGFVSFANALPHHRLLPFNAIKRAIQEVSRDASGIYLAMEERRGYLNLREEIARRSFTWNGAAAPADLIITNGAIEALILCLKAVTREGDTILVQDPCYYGVMQAVEYLNLEIVTIPCHSETGINLADLEAACEKLPVKACVLVSNFNNPNGASLSTEKKQQLAAIANARQLPVIEDDLYGDIFFTNHRPDTIKAYDEDGWVLYCSSFSKSLAPGLRIGWCNAGRFADAVARLKSMINGPTSSFTQRALHRLLAAGVYERHLKKFRIELQKNLVRATAIITEYFPEGTKISAPLGGLVIWVELPAHINTVQLQDEAYRLGISYAPGEIFSAKGDYQNYLRLSYCMPWEAKTENALRKLGELFKAQILKSA